MDWSLNVRHARNRAAETIAIYDIKGGQHVLTVKRSGTVKCLGVLFNSELTGKPQLRAALLEFRKIMVAVATRRASPELIEAVLESSLLPWDPQRVVSRSVHSIRCCTCA